MNRKNPMELMVAIAATAALCGCESAPVPLHTADRGEVSASELDSARGAWVECVRAAIPRLDHPESSSAVVASAAMSGCSGESTQMERVLARTLVPTCGQDADCTRNALAKAHREATQAAVDDVITARVRVAGAQVLKCE
jgi:hypothetical protein